MNAALSPCPFCGQAATRRLVTQGCDHGRDPMDTLYIGCPSCGVWLTCSNYPGYMTASQKEELAARWNHRAAGAQQPGTAWTPSDGTLYIAGFFTANGYYPSLVQAFDAGRASHGQAPAQAAPLKTEHWNPMEGGNAETALQMACVIAHRDAQAAPAYKGSTPELTVGDSPFESWYSSYSPAHKGDKQRARDAYAAGVDDPLVTAAPAAVAGPSEAGFAVELDDAQEARFANWHRVDELTPWQRSVARLALLLNTTKRGLIDYEAAQHFANELMARAAAPTVQPAPQQEASPTTGMNIAQRILHVGGRNNAAGYVEFGSIQAVEALVRQVLRDLPPAPQAAAR